MATVDEIIPLLRKVSLFEGLPREDLERLADIGEERVLPAGETLFEEGEEGDAFFAVVSGAVEILRRRTDGTMERLAIRRSGDAFGEIALLDEGPRSATARTLEETRLMVLSRADFRGLLDPESPAFRVLTSLSKALRALDIRFTAQQKGVAEGEAIRGFNFLLRQGLLPRDVPSSDGYELAAGTSVAEGGTGDTAWDSFRLSDGPAGLVAFQVKGEGLPPAHHIAVARAVIRTAALRAPNLDQLLSDANEALAQLAMEGVDQVIECGFLFPADGSVRWAGAGSSAGILVTGDGAVRELAPSGPPLGMIAGSKYTSRTVPLGVGDVALAMSRGSVGLVRGAGDLVASLIGKSAADVVSALHGALARAHPVGTEITVLMVRRTQ